ncbi:MAG: hypothetical protein NC485_14375 [Ruminococcus flavefaciens]|nr:hypothetical protein [Ruminococcus flavefaciens]
MLNKKLKYAVIVIVLINILTLLFVLSACSDPKPWDYENVEWYSEMPSIQFVKTEDKYWEGTLKTKDETFQIQMLWGPTYSFEIIDATKDDGSTPVEDMLLIRGEVKFDNTSAVLVIKTDNIFNGEYKQIVLSHRDV